MLLDLITKPFFSCYVSSNIPLKDFEIFLKELSVNFETYGKNRTIIAGDFNAKNKLWGSRINDKRGELLIEWIAQHNLSVINEGMASICVCKQGESVVDITLCTGDLANKIKDWKVLEDIETLFDHRYIVMCISKEKGGPIRGKQS